MAIGKDGRVIFDDVEGTMTEEERASFPDGYSFKVVAELRDGLHEINKITAEIKINEYKKQFKIANLDDITYCKKLPIIDEGDEFGAVTFFYCALKEFKNSFSRLEYYDLRESYKRVAV